MAENLANVINSWFEHKSIPLSHLTSRLILILKKPVNLEEGNLLDDFRPISVTSVLFKLIEIIIYRRVKQHLSNGTIRPLNRSQTGFQPMVGCEVNIMKLII